MFADSKKVLIVNPVNFHYEIIESVICKVKIFFKIEPNTDINIFLDVYDDSIFKNYIKSKYPQIQFQSIKDYDYCVHCTIYDKDFYNLENDSNSKHRYISHVISTRLQMNKNVFFLTPLATTNYFYADILPFMNEKKIQSKPIFVIQGNLNQNRRNLNLLIEILENKYKYDFTIKLIGRGYLPKELERFKNSIILKTNLNFIDYHNEFKDAYGLLPLISKSTHPQYYNNKLTSSINYARSYKLKCIIDKDLQDIYKLDDVEIYTSIDNIAKSFGRALKNFYLKYL